MPEITRETLPDGTLRLAGGRATFAYRRLRPGALLVTISGIDEGQFGTATLDEIRMEMLRHRPVELFIDTAAAIAVTGSVPQEWTQFFALNREHLTRVSVLVGNKAIELTVAIAQHLSQTGNLIQIYSDAELFAARVAAAASHR
ncbi:hypothetical protein [Caenimonas aquaedulcis]|uniref:Uncharacterized protein n=1 Tax=Caenimonas aquaedulcis TaxID=2793270 RepID=A0A931H4J9_9BURK|nr:hypothetical protein [Caenimonas aquaedulcis]MBG9388335.1 hypothetical protein [Caenimonas aquaedulcis]